MFLEFLAKHSHTHTHTHTHEKLTYLLRQRFVGIEGEVQKLQVFVGTIQQAPVHRGNLLGHIRLLLLVEIEVIQQPFLELGGGGGGGTTSS